MRKMAKGIFEKAVSAVNPSEALKRSVQIQNNLLTIQVFDNPAESFDLTAFQRVFLVGTGKASASMAQAIEEIFVDRLTSGVITTKTGHGLPLKKTEVIEAGHPLPDQKGIEGAKKIQSLLKESGEKDLVLFLISGGGSALLPLPVDGISLEEKQKTTQLLLDCGADIIEMNTIRKHISQTKGGWLARWAYPSTVITFILSDVVGDPLDSIASGPTVPDTSTFEEAWEILEKYDLIQKVPSSVRNHLLSGKEKKSEETPKPGDVVFNKIHNILIGSNILALRAAEKEASSLGFNTIILSSSIVGETREVARFHGALAKEVISTGHPIPRPACIISGGETTVTIKGQGKGGRNQEFVLAGAFEIENLEKIVLLSGGTDGTDGPTDAAGAIADHTTIKRAQRLGLDAKAHLNNNDAYPFFQKLGDLLMTGPTQTNVMDVRILLIA
ncbi:MAG: glycerate kinase [Deltaproteobacteria bacterium]|nr:glycerate kinase [Deltaproteobacteria bacterium]